MENCVNRSLPEFLQIQKETGLNSTILAAKISLWQDTNGLDKFPSIDELNLQEFYDNSLKSHPELSDIQTNEIVSNLCFIALYDITELKNIVDQLDLSKVEKQLAMRLKSLLNNTDTSEEIKQEYIKRFQYILNDQGKLHSFWKNKVFNYIETNFKIQNLSSIDYTEEDLQEDSETADGENAIFEKQSYESSGYLKATPNIKYIIGTIPDIKEYKDGKVVYNNGEFLGLPLLKDPKTVWSSVSNSVYEIVQHKNEDGILQDSYDLMISKLKSQIKYKPELGFLADKVSKMDTIVRNQFVNTFSQQKGRYIDHIIAGTVGAPISKITDSNTEGRDTNILNQWNSLFIKKFSIGDKYSSEALSKLKESINNYDSTFKEEIKAGNITERTFSKLNTIFNNLGINLNSNTVPYILETKYNNVSQATLPLALRNLTLDLYNALTQLKNLNADTEITAKTNLLLNNKSFFKEILANSEAYFTKVGGEDMFKGPEGNKTYLMQNHSTMSVRISEWKNNDFEYLNDLKQNDYSSNSYWLNQLLDSNNALRKDFILTPYGNFRYNTEDNNTFGDKASNLKPIDSYIDQVNKQLNGYFIGLAEADKGQQTYIKGPKLLESEITYDPSTDNIYLNRDVTDATTVLTGYLLGELRRMRTAWEAMYGENKLKDEELTLYYHYIESKDGAKLPGNAFNSFLFPNINLVELGLKNEDTDIPGEILLDKLDINQLLSNTMLTDYINEVITTNIKANLEIAINNELISKRVETNGSGQNVTKYTNRWIDSNYLNKYNYYLDVSAQSSAIVSSIADYTINSIIGNVEQTMLFNGDPALYKVKYGKDKLWQEQDIFADFKKRIPAIGANGKLFRIYNDENGIPVVRPYYTSATISNISVSSSVFGDPDKKGEFNEDTIKKIAEHTNTLIKDVKALLKPYLNINQTDAQAWITLDVYKERLLGLGKWTDAHEVSYNKIKDGETLSFKDKSILAQPLKTVHVELKKNSQNTMVMHYNKQSEAVLLPFLTKGTELDNLRLAMESQKVDHVIVLDGKKVGASGITNILDEQGNIKPGSDIIFNPTNLSYRGLFLQQDLPPHGIDSRLVGSQAVKNVMSVVSKNEEGLKLVDEYHSVISKLSDKGLLKIKSVLGYDPVLKFTEDSNGKSKFFDTLHKEFYNDLSDNYLTGLKKKYPIDALPLRNKIQNKLHALITKSAVKLQQLGGALIQISDLGLIGVEVNMNTPVKDGIIWFKNPTEKLKAMSIDEEGVKPAQILMPYAKMMQDSRINLIIKNKFGVDSYKELSANQIKELISSKVLEGLSYRIPNQGPSSNDAFEIVGILPPEMGDSIVSFSDITTKTGSDFDIDKSFIILPNYHFDAKANKIKYVEYDPLNESKEGLENRRLELMREMLIRPEAYLSVMAPLDDPWLEDVAKDLFPEVLTNNDLQFFNGIEQLSNKILFDNAKSLVGTIANHMSNHSLFLHENIGFNDYYLGKGIQVDKNTLLSNKVDESGNKIENTLGAFMNAIVDAAKDPYISRANINQFTAGTAFMLARAGVDREWIVSFIGQPILKDLYAETQKAESEAASERRDTKGKKLRPLDIVIKKYNPTATKDNLKEFKLEKNTNKEINIPKEDLQSYIKEGSLDNSNFTDKQLAILNQFIEWQGKSRELNDLLKLTKVDVDGAFRNLNRVNLYLKLYNNVVGGNKFTGIDNILGVNPESTNMIATYIQNGPKAAKEMYGSMFLETTPAFDNIVDQILKSSGYLDLGMSKKNELLLDWVSNEVYAYTIADTDYFNIGQEQLKEIFFGSKTTPDLGEEIIQYRKDNPNVLLDSLNIEISSKDLTDKEFLKAPCKITLDNNEQVKQLQNQFYKEWEKLYYDNPTLGKKLVQYAFYSSGFYSKNSLQDHIPLNILNSTGYFDDFTDSRKFYSKNQFALDGSLDIIYKNLSYINELVPKINLSITSAIADDKGNVFDTEDGFILADLNPSYIAGLDSNNSVVWKRFLKTTNNLYQWQGYTQDGLGAVYLKVNKLGFNNLGRSLKEYTTENSIITENNVSLPEALTKVASGLSSIKYPVTKFTEKDIEDVVQGDITERLNYCKIV